eukprot:m.67579 g.67579  ORF g.67579 m.67579 type:complete len:183 (+) comp12163_c0_seq17:1741-2289(+)
MASKTIFLPLLYPSVLCECSILFFGGSRILLCIVWFDREAFILNLPPDTTGRIPQEYVDEVTKFGDALRVSFNSSLAEINNVTLTCSEPLVLNFTQLVTVDTTMLREDLTQGQAVATYSIDVLNSDGVWIPQNGVNGETVGNKVIDFFEATSTTAVRFRCMSSVRSELYLRHFGAYKSQPPQ